MTAIPSREPDDERLNRAVDALRRSAVPSGPPDETIARALAALQTASEARTIPFYRRKTMQYVWKIAAVGALAAAVAAYVAGLLASRAPLAFAEVAANLRDARTLTFEETYQLPKQKEPVKMKVLYKEPGWMRTEGAGQIGIANLKQGKTLLLDTATRTAMLVEFTKSADTKKKTRENPQEIIEWLRNLADKKTDSLGKKRIGDIEAEGFRVEEEGLKLTVWADPKTKMPVLIEMPIRVADEETVITLSDFQLNAKLDDALFTLEPPEGYKLRKMEIEQGKPEEDVVHLLRAYADKFDGKFPPQLSISSKEWQTYFRERWGDKKEKGLPEPAVMQFMQRAIQVEMFLRTNKDHGYKPEGTKLGERNKIVFWYRPDGVEKYRAVFGDLHTADVTADQLPQKPKK